MSLFHSGQLISAISVQREFGLILNGAELFKAWQVWGGVDPVV